MNEQMNRDLMPRVAVVNELDLSTSVGDCTPVELLNFARIRADELKERAVSGDVAREFALAITHIEDAITRYNKASYRLAGTFAISDAERATV